MPFNAAGLTQLAAGFTAAGATAVNPYIQLHSADPSTTGANPTTHGRVQAGFTNTNGVLSITSKNFTGGTASGAVTWVGLWSASTGGTFYGGFQISTSAGNDLASNAAGAYTLNSLTITGA